MGGERLEHRGELKSRTPLQPVVDEQVGVEVRDHRRVALDRWQRAAHAREGARVIGQRRRRQHVMSDLVREHLDGERREPALRDLLQVDHHRLIDQPDHCEAAVQSLRPRVGGREAQCRRAQAHVAAPGRKRLGPRGHPPLAQRTAIRIRGGRGRHERATSVIWWLSDQVTASVVRVFAQLVTRPAAGSCTRPRGVVTSPSAVSDTSTSRPAGA